MKYGLSDKATIAIQNVFSRFPQVGAVILYGSRAKGNYREGSDIDLTLIAVDGQSIDLGTRFKIDEALDELMLPYSFDISVMAEIDNPALIDHIERVGKDFYQKSSTF